MHRKCHSKQIYFTDLSKYRSVPRKLRIVITPRTTTDGIVATFFSRRAARNENKMIFASSGSTAVILIY